jgi:hypothetical protein
MRRYYKVHPFTGKLMNYKPNLRGHGFSRFFPAEAITTNMIQIAFYNEVIGDWQLAIDAAVITNCQYHQLLCRQLRSISNNHEL